MFHFKQITLLCLGYRLSGHKITICSKNLERAMAPSGYACGYIPWSSVQCDGCAWRLSQHFKILGDILVRYSRRSARLWINTRVLCFEH